MTLSTRNDAEYYERKGEKRRVLKWQKITWYSSVGEYIENEKLCELITEYRWRICVFRGSSHTNRKMRLIGTLKENGLE